MNQITQNNRAYHKFFIEKIIESGLVLSGWEVKSARSHRVSIENSYISFNHEEAYIYNSIFQIQNTSNNYFNYNPHRARKLLLKKKELSFLKKKINLHGYTIIILNLFWKKSWIKANIGLAKGKKKYDKRHIIEKNKWKIEKKHISECINK